MYLSLTVYVDSLAVKRVVGEVSRVLFRQQLLLIDVGVHADLTQRPEYAAGAELADPYAFRVQLALALLLVPVEVPFEVIDAVSRALVGIYFFLDIGELVWDGGGLGRYGAEALLHVVYELAAVDQALVLEDEQRALLRQVVLFSVPDSAVVNAAVLLVYQQFPILLVDLMLVLRAETLSLNFNSLVFKGAHLRVQKIVNLKALVVAECVPYSKVVRLARHVLVQKLDIEEWCLYLSLFPRHIRLRVILSVQDHLNLPLQVLEALLRLLLLIGLRLFDTLIVRSVLQRVR